MTRAIFEADPIRRIQPPFGPANSPGFVRVRRILGVQIMGWTTISGQLLARGALLAAGIFCYSVLRGTSFSELTARDAEGLNTLILLMGSIYAVMYAFVIFVIW